MLFCVSHLRILTPLPYSCHMRHYRYRYSRGTDVVNGRDLNLQIETLSLLSVNHQPSVRTVCKSMHRFLYRGSIRKFSANEL